MFFASIFQCIMSMNTKCLYIIVPSMQQGPFYLGRDEKTSRDNLFQRMTKHDKKKT